MCERESESQGMKLERKRLGKRSHGSYKDGS